MKLSLFICLFSFLLIPLSYGQFNINQFLSRTVDEVEINALGEEARFLQEGNFKSPFLREVEFRMRFIDLTGLGSLEDYRLRFSPTNPYVAKANREHVTYLERQNQTENLVAFSKVLSRRYSLIIDYFYLLETRRIQELENSRYRTLIKNSKREKDAGIYLIKMDKKLLESQLEIEDITSELRYLEFLIRESYDFEGEINFDQFEMVSVSTIESEINRGKATDETNLYVLNEQNKLKVADSRLNIERKEAFNNIGFIQAEYRPFRKEEISDKFGIQIGALIPVTNPDRPELARRELDLIGDQNDVNEVEREVNNRIFLTENGLKSFIKQYQTVSSKINSFTELESLPIYQVEAILEIESYRNELMDTRTRIYRDILSNYIQWLDYNGVLSQTPIINYLSENKEPIEIDTTIN